jgi:phage tail-like protein
MDPDGATDADPTSGNGYFTTYEGRGFGTRTRHISVGRAEVPGVASQRRYLRHALPGVYLQDPAEASFVLGFLEALEEVLDPILAILDSFPAYLHPDCAPTDLVDLLVAWLGVSLEGVQELHDPHKRREREALVHAAELARRRGTVRGLELALRLHFPDIADSFRIADNGGVHFPGEPDEDADEIADRIPPGGFVVICDANITKPLASAIERCIQRHAPAHTPFKLHLPPHVIKSFAQS